MTDAADDKAYELLQQMASVWKRGESLHNHAPIIATALREAYKAHDALAAALKIIAGGGVVTGVGATKLLDQHVPGWRSK